MMECGNEEREKRVFVCGIESDVKTGVGGGCWRRGSESFFLACLLACLDCS
jgi:hypothetical protein